MNGISNIVSISVWGEWVYNGVYKQNAGEDETEDSHFWLGSPAYQACSTDPQIPTAAQWTL